MDWSTTTASTRSTSTRPSDMSSGSGSSGLDDAETTLHSEEPSAAAAAPPTEREKVYVAAGKDVKEWKANLLWVLQNVPREKKIVILHVHRPAKTIPLMGGYFPADQLNDHEVATFRQIETQTMNKTMLKYQTMCARVKVRAEKLVIEMDDIVEGIVMLISQHQITELVMGAAADKQFTKKLKAPISKTALAVQRQADSSCKIWFLCKGNLICTRPGNPNGQSSIVINLWDGVPKKASHGSENSFHSKDVGANNEIYKDFQSMLTETEKLRREAYQETLRHQIDERDLSDAPQSAKTFNNSYPKEMLPSREVPGMRGREATELEDVKRQRDEICEELQKEHEQRAQLELQIINSNRVIKDLQEKLSEAHCLLFSLEREQEELRQERDDALKEAERFRRRVKELGIIQCSTENFSEFSYAELEEAANNFDESLKIGEGGYGSVYKGVLRHTTVAIKLLNPQGMQGKSEFHKEMDVLSKVRHPNLVTLIGACPEAWALVYEFLPNGSLEDRLSCKNNTPPLTWQARTRIATEMCSALIFLHTHKPLTVIHGDLKPANILLDANFVSQLGDFGICRLLESNANTILFRCTHPMGTFVYMDPEFLASGELRPCSDVYSYEILDASAGEWPFEQAEQLAELGLKCCEIKRKNRPDLAGEAWNILEPMMKAS
ncbi:U-box domain-containing protein 33 [Ananas comosus]|uniref:RING-type E3 ubiquitin transferase n=1 Tax=Ananas comosus TaxID=4615 RepID=A0A199W3L8_ANACO|nr:U-box domain-containing protein 33 [Ananas comosus]